MAVYSHVTESLSWYICKHSFQRSDFTRETGIVWSVFNIETRFCVEEVVLESAALTMTPQFANHVLFVV